MREIRKIKHDMNAHINILYNLLDTEQYDEAVKYIYDIKMHYDIGKKLESYYDNGIIDAIIYYFNQKFQMQLKHVVDYRKKRKKL